MTQTIEVEVKQAYRCWIAVVRRNGVWVYQAQASTSEEALARAYMMLRELRDGIDRVLEVSP
jgi:hypothetical protein